MGNAYPVVLDINALVGVQVPHCEYPSMILANFASSSVLLPSQAVLIIGGGGHDTVS